MNGAVAILTLLNLMAIGCWIYFRLTDHHVQGLPGDNLD